jgi:AcrR family transcriptional regulator
MVAAVRAISEHGYHGTSVRDIAAEAGLTSGAIYHHFGSKHSLLVALIDRGMDFLLSSTEDALFNAGDRPEERLRAIVTAHVLAHTEAPRESYIGNSELRSLSPDAFTLVNSKRDAQQRIFYRVIADGVHRGAFTTPHPLEAARFIMTACTTVASWYHKGGDNSAAEIAERYTELALSAVGHRGR